MLKLLKSLKALPVMSGKKHQTLTLSGKWQLGSIYLKEVKSNKTNILTCL